MKQKLLVMLISIHRLAIIESCTSTKQFISTQITMRPIIKHYDLRCSRGCVRNWTMFGQKPPVYQICDCVVNMRKHNKNKNKT